MLVLDGVDRIENGQPQEGAARILDAMQFAQDVTRSHYDIEQIIGLSMLAPGGLLEVLESTPLTSFPPEALEILERGVGRLVATTRPYPDYRGEAVIEGLTILDARDRGLAHLDTWHEPPIPTRRAAHEFARAIPLLERLPTADFDGIRELFGGYDFSDRIGTLSPGVWATLLHSWRTCLGRLRLLHHALREALGLEPLPFEDPFGEELGVVDEPGLRRLVVGTEESDYTIELVLAR